MDNVVRLDYYKSTNHMHVYRTRNTDAFTPNIYIRKRAVAGEKPPAYITLIHFQSEETTDEHIR
jgi:hypothetical protein